MKTLLFLSLMAMLSFSSTATADNTQPAPGSAVYVSVNGLVCDFCARALEKVFGKQDAVEKIDVDLNSKIITVHFKPDQTLNDDTITRLVSDSGYHVEAIRYEK